VIEYYYRLRTGGESLCNRLMPTTLDELDYQEYYNFNAASAALVVCVQHTGQAHCAKLWATSVSVQC